MNRAGKCNSEAVKLIDGSTERTCSYDELCSLVVNATKEAQREFFGAVLEGPPTFPELLTGCARSKGTLESHRERLRKHWRLRR